MKPWLFGMTLARLGEVVAELGMPRYAASQLASWLYVRSASSWEEMTDLSKRNRQRLAEHYQIGRFDFVGVQSSTDGTKKYLFPTLQGAYIESAYIPDKDRATLCVSSQSGCRMGCRFCMTARQGFSHHLTSGEILNQMRSIPESETLTNMVYMGMGEPLDNWTNVADSLEVLTAPWGYAWSPTRITLSTVGIIPFLHKFLSESKVHLAVSLHNPIGEQRRELMPVEQKYPIAEVVEVLRHYDFSHQRRVSFEYIMFRGWNDTSAHIQALSRLLGGLKCRVNLIRFHAIPDAPLEGSDEATMIRFRDALTRKGIITTIRASRGEDIQAACGLLSTLEQQKAKK